MTDAIEKRTQQQVINPFQKQLDERTVAGAVAIEEARAIAEVQAALVIARRFPRDRHAAFEELREACKKKGLAEEAFYLFKRGKEDVTGPSIRLVEEMARCWPNFNYGFAELSRTAEGVEMMAYAHDLERNVRTEQRFFVRNVRDTQAGASKLTTERDIYENSANMASRRLRARILAILPADYVDGGVEVAKATLAAKEQGKPIGKRVEAVLNAFKRHNVDRAMLEANVGKPLEQLDDAGFTTLKGIDNALRDGAKVETYFRPPLATEPGAEKKTDAPAQTEPRVEREPEAPPQTSGTPPAAKAPAAEPPKRGQRRMPIQDVPAPEGAPPTGGAATAVVPLTAPAEPRVEREPGSDDDDAIFPET